MYSSAEIAGAQYLIETRAGWQVDDKKGLKDAIEKILSDKDERSHVLNNAMLTASQNHDIQRNVEKFYRNIVQLVEMYK